MNQLANIVRGSKTYELPITRNYVSAWGIKEAVRELLQNALDSDSPLETKYDEHGQVFTIHSRYSALPLQSLLLGATTKADLSDKIGSFGEGYKLAMLVLTREEHHVELYNDGVLWEPHFQESKTFGVETLCVTETKLRKSDFNPEGVMFIINGVTETDYAYIKETCLHLWPKEDIGETIRTDMGSILMDPGQKGKLYVNGLYVCDTDMKHGYDVKPEHITLERDRQTVNTWDLYSLTKEMWFHTKGKTDYIAEMIEKGDRDLHYADFNTPDVVKEACYQHFMKKHPGKIGARNQEEMERYVTQGMTNTVIVRDTYQNILMKNDNYAEAAKLKPQPKPVQILKDFYDNRTSTWDAHDHEAWNNLFEQALKWK